MIADLNRRLEKALPLLTPLGVLFGVLFAEQLRPLVFLVPWLFAVMTFCGSISSGFGHLARAIMHPLPIVVALTILHLIMPAAAWSVGHLIYPNDPHTITGLILGMCIPVAITSLIWVNIHRGNAPVTLALVIANTLLSPIIVPACLALFAGNVVQTDTTALMKGLLLMVVLPSAVGMTLYHLSKGRTATKLAPLLAPVPKLLLGFVVALNGSIVAPYLARIDGKLLLLTAVVFALAASGYAVGMLIARLLRWPQPEVVSLTYNSGMRNISAGAVIATTYFPAAVAVPVIIGMLFQQLLASVYGALLRRQSSHAAAASTAGAVRL